MRGGPKGDRPSLLDQTREAEMMQPFRLPLLPVLIAYGIGLFIGQFNLRSSLSSIPFLFALLSLWLLLILLKKIRWASFLLLSFFFFLGFFSIQNYLYPNLPPSHLSHFIGSEDIVLEGTVDRSPQRTRTGTQLLIQAHKIISGNHSIPVEGRLLLFLKESDPRLRIGDRVRFLCRLHRPHGFHNPGVFSYERHLAFKRIYTIGFLSSERGWVKVGEGFKNSILLKIESWRDHIRNFLQKEATPPSSSLFQALVLGEQETIPEEIRESFITTGIAHLLAISGDHLGIVAFLSFTLFLWGMKRSEYLLLSIPVKKWAAGLTLPCLLLYTFIAGGGISVIRATIMVLTFFLAIVFDRTRHLLYTLGLAAFLILLFSPPSLFDVSFQLSFIAVLSILYLVPRLYRNLKSEGMDIPQPFSRREKIGKYIKLSFLATVVAILGTAPFVALHFNRISLIGFFANLVSIPWVGFLIMPISLIASLFSFFFSPLANLLITVNQFFVILLLKAISLCASIPFVSVYLPTPTPLEMILFYFLLFLGVHLRKDKKIKYLFAAICIIFIGDLAYWHYQGTFRKELQVTFIDVGHGDSILIEFPKGKTMLIDGGGLPDNRFDIGENVIAPFLWKKKIRRIDILVLTHPDPDHFKGLNFIASHFHIGQFWDNGARIESESYFDLEKTLKRKKITPLSLHKGFPPQSVNGVQISILNPPIQNSGFRTQRTPSLLNNQSLVMRLRFHQVSFLLTGDIEKEVEVRMLQKGDSLRAQILKVPHHGSLSSSSPLFLEAVQPEYAVVSTGKGTLWPLPHPEVVERYERLGAKLFRTDLHGAITVITDGQQVKVIPFRRH